MSTLELAPRAGLRAWAPLVHVLCPACGHAIAFAVSARGNRLGTADIGLFLGLVAYLIGVVLLSQKRQLMPKVALAVYSVGLPLAAANGLLSLVFPLPPDEVPIRPIRRVSQASSAMPGISGEIDYSVSGLGLRAPEKGFAEAQYRVLCIGGSTTECLYVTNEKSWPWLLQTKLNMARQQPVFVGNAGKAGEFTLHHAETIQKFKLVDQFDLVVVLCGMCDMGCMLRDNYHERRQKVPHEALTPALSQAIYYRKLALVRLAERWYTRRSTDTVRAAVQDDAGLWYDEQRSLRQQMLQKQTLAQPPARLSQAVAQYKQDLLAVIQAARARQVRLVFMTQPTIYRADLPAELEKLLWIHSEEGAYTPGVLAEMMARYNQTLREVAAEQNIECLDLANIIPKDTTAFYDDCHFNTQGCSQVAEALFEYLQSNEPDGA